MNKEEASVYSIPLKFRRLENMHILFWLVKDICWCIGFKPLGVAMIFPTLAIAIYITWRNREIVAELAHNLAVAFWITANSMWMIFEFMGRDEQLKNYCIIPFGIGLLILGYYYLVYVPLRKVKAQSSKVKSIETEKVLETDNLNLKTRN